MKLLHDGNVVQLPLDQIVIGERLRGTSEDQVDALIQMAEDTGITTPIHVRKVKTAYHLIDGGHRIAAARKMGLAQIAALVVDCRQDEARAMEASNNLGAARMSPLQIAVFVASWRKAYYELHPDRKPGMFKGNRHTGKLVGANFALTRSVAQAFGVKDRSAHNFMKAGEQLSPDEARQIELSGQRVTMQELQALARIGNPDERAYVVAEMIEGKKAGTARLAWKARENGVQPPVKSKVDAEFHALNAAWSRASEAARKRFCLEQARDIWTVQNKGVPLAKWSEASDE